MKKAAVEDILESLASDFFETLNLSAAAKSDIFSGIMAGIEENRAELLKLAVRETGLTRDDADKEIDRARHTFKFAKEHSGTINGKVTDLGDKLAHEKRIPRGPLMAITPFSSPFSSPAHKISMGLLAGTSILFKPSPLAQKSGRALYEIIRKACGGRYVYFSSESNEDVLKKIVSDDRIGIISFTGGYDTGEKLIKNGGVKRYLMELSGGNTPVIFTPGFKAYDDQLAVRLLDGITAKNGQRCVSVKHLFVPAEHRDFVIKLQNKMSNLKTGTKNQIEKGQAADIGPLITEDYAKKTEAAVRTILNSASDHEALIPLERSRDYIFPTMYELPKLGTSFLKQLFKYDIAGPVVFVHLYETRAEYEDIFSALKRDYIRSGLQLSIYADKPSMQKLSKDLLWGGIIFNELPTFRHDLVPFGGFGRAGLGKESLYETINMYTDPQTIVYPKEWAN